MAANGNSTSNTTGPVCRSGAPPSILPLIRDGAGNVTCLPGFHCPLLDPADPSTFPIGCIPTPECQIDRMNQGICSARQSALEPEICPAGKECPTPQTKRDCPSGHFCTPGTYRANKCPALSLCSEGAAKPREYGPLIFLIIVIFALIVIRRLYLNVWRLRGHMPGDGLTARSPLQRSQEVSTSEATEPSAVAMEAAASPTRLETQNKLVRLFQGVSSGSTPIQLDFTDLRVTVPADGQKPEKVLLEGVSGSLKPGTVTAILGPSGAGKTVLLTTLLQRLNPTWKVEGHLDVNKGKGDFAALRSSIGFVPQDDTLHNELTVEANIYYASELRLPAEWTGDRRQQMREVVLEALGLTQHRTTVIGTEAERGVSGGQRKRASIGVELASAPLMLLLDEPTSGLDSTTSLELVRTLKEVAVAAKITVVMVIHQPRVEIWKALDELLILGVGGRTVFKGPLRDVQPYFEEQGVPFNPKHNPADVVVDAIVSDSARYVQKWAERDYVHSETATPLHLATDASAGFHGASPVKQFGLFVLRSWEKQLSDFTPFVVEAVVIFLCGLILGNSMGEFTLDANYISPYESISPTAFALLLPQLHMYQLMSLGLAAAVAGVNVLGAERQQYFREVPTGLNRVAYFSANVVAAWPRVCIVTLIYSSFFTFLAALPVPFQYLYFAALLSYWGIYGLGACVSVTASREASALIASTGSICFAVFNGFIEFPIWMKRLTVGFYASQVLQEQHARWISHWAANPMAEDEAGFEAGRQTESFFLMVLIGIALHVIAFLLMIGTHRDKQCTTAGSLFGGARTSSARATAPTVTPAEASSLLQVPLIADPPARLRRPASSPQLATHGAKSAAASRDADDAATASPRPVPLFSGLPARDRLEAEFPRGPPSHLSDYL